MRTGKAVLLIAAVHMFWLTACGGRTDGEAVSAISVKKDGSISSRIVEDFGESYYDADALEAMIESSIAEYKAQDSTAVITLRSCEAADGVVNVLMEFDGYASYAGFNDERFFAGTVQEADQAGFDLNVTLNAASDKAGAASISRAGLLEMGSRHIVMFEAGSAGDGQEAETMRINCFDEILYVGNGVTAVGKKSADVKLQGGYGIIVFK